MSIKEEILQGIACDSVKKPESIAGRAVCLSLHPGKMVLFPFIKWFNTRYKGRYKFARTFFAIDMLLIGLIAGLSVAALVLHLYHPPTIADKISFDANVAPRDVISGSPSTLTIHLRNDADVTLEDVRLEFEYPAHFLLQELSVGTELLEDGVIHVEDIPPGGTGAYHIKGVMFGDVGGEQTFTSRLSFSYLDKEDRRYETKISDHTFSPVASTLQLELDLPDRLVAFQDVTGVIRYINTGTIDFPTISIDPDWPVNFDLLSSDLELVDGQFVLPPLAAGEVGELSFRGYLGNADDEVSFLFHPSFTFGHTRYRQDSLTSVSPVVPPQVDMTLSVDKTTVRPGSSAVFTLQYSNTGDVPATNVEVGIESESPFLADETYTLSVDESLEPGESGVAELTVPLARYISPSQTESYENLDLVVRPIAVYTIGDGSGQRVSIKGDELTTAMTTPVLFESFARYATETGDQLGRGPLPPKVGKETKYWLFLRIGGTTNTLENLQITAQLPSNVTFTGRQSSSHNSGIVHDASTNTVSWSSTELEPTLDPTAIVTGIAFEVAVTPLESQVGFFAPLLTDVLFTARDARTGAFVSKYGATITSNLPNDLMAKDKGIVVE